MNKNDTNNKATRSKIIAQFLNFGGAGCLDDNPLNPNGKKHYCILRSFREKNIDIRLYLSNAGTIRLCVYSSGENPRADLDILRKVNIHPTTGAECVIGAEKGKDRDGATNYTLFHLVRYIDWLKMTDDDTVTIFADYCWLIAELHRIEAV